MSQGELKDLRRRIKSVENTKQVTHAMQMIAASRIQKARRRVEESRPYAEMIEEIIQGLMASAEAEEHPLLVQRDRIETVALCTITSDRGLAGAYNANVFRHADKLIQEERNEGHDIVLYVVGEKGVRRFEFQGYDIERTWTGFTEQPDVADAELIADALMEGFREERFDRVWLVYTEFENMMRQVVKDQQLLPVDVEELEGDDEDDDELLAEFMFEPEPEEILERLIPRYVEAQVYAAMLSAAASQLAMRQQAMKQATENAEEVQEDLSRQLNRARQQQITQEIMEISAGAEALSGS